MCEITKQFSFWVGERRYVVRIRYGVVEKIEKCERVKFGELDDVARNLILSKFAELGIGTYVNQNGTIYLRGRNDE